MGRGKYKIQFDGLVLLALERAAKYDKKYLKKVIKIFKNLNRTPFSPEYKYEALKGNLSGYHSKRIDKKNRVIYKVENDVITVISIEGHYDK